MRSINQSPPRSDRPPVKRPRREAGRVQPLVLVLVLAFLILGIVVGAFWYYRAAHARDLAADAVDAGIRLSDSTRTVLKRLDSPVEIRFYSLLDEEDKHDSLRDFTGRVNRLLAEFKQEADGSIEVTRYTSRSEDDLNSASSDGLSAFNLDKGEPCYLGLSVVQDDQKETLPRINPDWEQALEADLTRAILRVTGARSAAEQAAATAQADSAAGDEVKRSIPDFDSLSVEEARQVLRTRALEELKAALTELQAQVQQAQQRLSEAQNGESEAEQETAMKQLQQLQAAQTEKLNEIAARLKAQITAVEQLKGTPASNH